MKKLLLLLVAMVATAHVQAEPAFSGINYSGLYQCKGTNDQVGDYTVKAKLRLNRISSYGKFGAYYYEVETENGTTYHGQAAGEANRLAISFNLSEKRSAEHSTGLASFKKNAQGRWTFQKLYYESDDSGGIYGKENCTALPTPPAEKEPTATDKKKAS